MTTLETTLFNVTLSSFTQAQDMLNRINAYAATLGQLCELSPSAEPISLEQLEVIFKDMADTSANAAELIHGAIEGVNIYVDSHDDDHPDIASLHSSDLDNPTDHDLMPNPSTMPQSDLKHELAAAGYLHLPDYKIIRLTESYQSDGNYRYLVPITSTRLDGETEHQFVKRVGIQLAKPADLI